MRVPVHDPFGVTRDPAMGFLARALDPEGAEAQLGRVLDGPWRLQAIRVVRHKPGARCLVEYKLAGDGGATLTVLGKAHASGLDAATFRLYEELWRNGFADTSADGISIPEPIGMIPAFQMWLQREVPGTLAGDILPGTRGPVIAARIAEAIRKLHDCGVPARREHTIRDELDILHKRLGNLADARPEWARRLETLITVCDHAGSAIPGPDTCGIHRDFYQDHVVVDADRLYLLDLDLYAEGDPALDAGNLIAHLTEWSLRALGNPEALRDRQEAFERRFFELTGANCRAAVQTYTFLSLVRHISISAQIPDRRPFTESILRLCETARPYLALHGS